MDFQKVSLKKKKLDKIREVKKVLKSELKVESINLWLQFQEDKKCQRSRKI